MSEPYKKQKLDDFYEGFEDQGKLTILYQELIMLKNNMFKVNLLLDNEEESSTIDELNNIKDELHLAIEEKSKEIAATTKQQDLYSVNRLNSEDIDKLVKAYHEQDKKWYNAKLLQIDTEEQEANVQFIGYPEVLKLHAIYIKVQPIPDSKSYGVGQQCEAIYSLDGRYYQGVIERITEEGYHIRFKKNSNKEIVPLTYLREAKKQLNEGKKNNFEDVDEFVVPDNLKYLPTDNEHQKQAKKKKLKALKQAFKQSQITKYTQEKQSSWQQFSQKVATIKPDLGQKAESIYRQKCDQLKE